MTIEEYIILYNTTKEVQDVLEEEIEHLEHKIEIYKRKIELRKKQFKQNTDAMTYYEKQIILKSTH